MRKCLLFVVCSLLLVGSASAQTFVDKRKSLNDTVFYAGNIVKLPRILFDLDKSTLRPGAIDSIKIIYSFLKAHPSFVVEIDQYTDTRTSPEYSQHLSLNRARTIVDTLIKMGIDPKRISAKGFEGTKPLIPDVQIKKLKTKEEQENAHQINRRTEMQIVFTDFGKRKTLKDSVFEVGDIIKCPMILFNFDAGGGIRSKDSLQLIADFLKKFSKLKVELGVHTDQRGAEKYNLALSNGRARQMSEELVTMGIDTSRIFYKGYGETLPFIIEKEIILPSGMELHPVAILTEDYLKMFTSNKENFEFLNGFNRRTELKILSTDFKK